VNKRSLRANQVLVADARPRRLFLGLGPALSPPQRRAFWCGDALIGTQVQYRATGPVPARIAAVLQGSRYPS